MTFPRVRAPGLWTLGSVIAPTEMELLDDDQSEAVDGTGGGAYAPTARVVLGGHGVDFTGGTGVDPNGPLTSTAAAATNASGVIATGDGTGYGVKGTGGVNGGGALFAAGGGNNFGLSASGTGSGNGGQFFGGPSSGVGVVGFGGAPDGYGVTGFGAGAGRGVYGTGDTTGPGVYGFGGSVSGYGGEFHAHAGTNTFGVVGFGNGTGEGVHGVGGATGSGVVGLGGATSGNGVYGVGVGAFAGLYAIAGSTNVGVQVHTGALWVETNIAAPSTAPGTNRLWAQNIAKAWGALTTDGLGGFTASEGINFTAATNVTQIDVTFITHMANANFDVSVQADSTAVTGFGSNYGGWVQIKNKSTSGFSILVSKVTPYDAGMSAVGVIGPLYRFDIGGVVVVLSFHVYAKQ